MNDEVEVYGNVEELEIEELGKLYGALDQTTPGTEEYNAILNEIVKIRSSYTEGSKIWSSIEQNIAQKELEEKKLRQTKVENVVKAIGIGANLLITTVMTWVTLKYNIKLGPVSSKEAWNMIFKKK